MLYITGDVHGDPDRIRDISMFCKDNNTTEDDYMIILGDVGINYWCDFRDIPVKKMLSDIQIACAGLIAEKVIFKTGCDGCDEDMQRVYKTAARAINRVGFASCSKTLPEVPPYRYIRNETEERRSRNEKEIEKLIRFCERKVTKFLRKNKKALIALANELFQKKNLKSFEVAHIIACNKRGGNYENC